MTIYTSQYHDDLNAAIAAAVPGSTVVVDRAITAKATVIVTKPLLIDFQATVDFVLVKDHGIQPRVPGVQLLGHPGVISIRNTYYSAIFLTSLLCDEFTAEDVSYQNYNTSNTNGNGGLFALNVIGLRARGVHSLGGNGNGIRLGNVTDCTVRDCYLTLTKGQSAEGVTVNGSNVLIDNLRVHKALTTGILVFPDRDMSNVRILNCTISDSSQAVLKPPLGISQVGNNFAVEVQAGKFNIKGLDIQGLCAYDDQTTPTQQGTLKVGNNLQGGTISMRLPTYMQWGNKTLSPEYVLDNAAKQLSFV